MSWSILPFEILQSIFKNSSTINLIKYDIMASLYSSDTLLQQTLHNIWTTRSNIISSLTELKNIKLLEKYLDKSQLYLVLEYAARAANTSNIGDIKWVKSILSICGNWNLKMEAAVKGDNLDLVKYLIKEHKFSLDSCMKCAVKNGNLKLVKYFTSLNSLSWHWDWSWPIEHAAQSGNLELVEYFIKASNFKYYQLGMKGSIKGGHLKLVQYFVDMGLDYNWNECMIQAVQNNHLDITEYFIKQGANNWNEGMKLAVKIENMEIINYFVAKGYNNWNEGMYYALENGNMILVKYFADKGANNWDRAMFHAIQNGSIEFVEYVVNQGYDYWQCAMEEAASKGKLKLIKYFVTKAGNNPINWNYVIIKAIKYGNLNIIKYLVEECLKDNFTTEDCIDWIEEANYVDYNNIIRYFVEKSKLLGDPIDPDMVGVDGFKNGWGCEW